jgi:hypothetical protein
VLQSVLSDQQAMRQLVGAAHVAQSHLIMQQQQQQLETEQQRWHN